MKLLVEESIDTYAHESTRPRPPLFDELRETTFRTMKYAQMQVGRIEGTLLKLLVSMMGARRVLEIGTFTGFSALCMAEALPDDGELITLDIDPEATGIAQQFFNRSPHGKKITIRLGDALDSLKSLPLAPAFDFAFVDADKERIGLYYEEILLRLRTGGLIVVDNTLWSGAVLAPKTESDRAIVAFNRSVTADERVENVLITVRDGMMLARKR